MLKKLHKNKYNSLPTRLNHSGGFTLIELLVVIFIFMIITSITIFSYGKFNSSLSLQNLADDIALSVRKAQGYAIGVHSSNDSFSSGYGVHFSTAISTTDLTSENAGSNKSFILFANINKDDRYDHNSTECGNPTDKNECLEVLKITSADKISEISVIINGEEKTVDTLDIFFKRPNPEPTFCARSSLGGDCSFSTNVSSVKITILNITNPETFKIITISNNGQISVSNPN